MKAGVFRIDMVAEGAQFYGPDRWQADMGRQRILERAGWTFWRCFASTWSLRRDAVLQELLNRLSNMGIEPLGALERVPSLVEYREWGREAQQVADDAAADMVEQAIGAAQA